jgi:hypothetical protein
MNTCRRALCLAALATFSLTHSGWTQLEWRVSVKRFTSSGGSPGISSASVSNWFPAANAILDKTRRGYRLVLTEIVSLPGTTQPGPSSTNTWFNADFSDDAVQNDLNAKALANRSAFAFRNDAINIYVNGNPGGGADCAFPADDHAIIANAGVPGETILHELGHYFGLLHTFEDDNCGKCDCATMTTFTAGNDDPQIRDTIGDNVCFNTSRNQLAMLNYNQPYANLTSAQQLLVDNTWFNMMSYRVVADRFTSDQMDFMTDNSNEGRLAIVSGRTWFVDRTAGCILPNGHSHCDGLAGPFPTVAGGIHAAGPGDIVMIRPGNYNEPMTISKRLYLRATRGNAVLGKP